jgi:diguanylate cyclase (GGDEF)-like protein/PAS domain S-box-containing protein
VRRVRRAAPASPVVVLTGTDDETLVTQALQAGAQDYLVKGRLDAPESARSLFHALRCAIDRKSIEDALFVEKERAQVTLNSIGEAVICTDLAGNITFLNVVAEELTGWTRKDAAGRPITEVFHIVDALSRQQTPYRAGAAAAQKQGADGPRHAMLVRRDGFEIPIEDSIAPIHDSEGRASGAVIVFRDVSAARSMALQIAYSAEHDFLTGLPNRALLNDRVAQSIASASRHGKQVAILFLDLDGFKHINDSLGHLVGDKLLRSIAKRLATCVRGMDTVCRQGGDEFVVLLSEVSYPGDIAAAAERILLAIAKSHSIDGRNIHVTTSIGVSVYPDDGRDAETLIKNADTAMYQAKENGRQTFVFFEPAMNARAVERQTVEEGLRSALERKEFTLHYQPKVDLRTGAITGAEALVRWIHPTLGLVPPAQFIPVAEASGLILPIGAWVLREACAQAQAWVDAGLPPITMAVNVSAMEFQDERFLANLFEILDDTGFSPECLELELTESVLMRRVDATAVVLETLRRRGVRAAVDDFGTGYSSLSYLQRFPVHTLKIDQSFVRQISASSDDTAIVTAVISMARSLRLRVIAEGVETLQQLIFLRAHQCDEGQGYYFSRPVLPAQFARLLQAGFSDSPVTGLRTPATVRSARVAIA